jgi:hypothetical protein
MEYENKILSERLDYWVIAYNALHGDKIQWAEGNEPSPMDVEHLAIFLAGENAA